ncbi:unnamed protein product, partial [Musa hybrid cultivar]
QTPEDEIDPRQISIRDLIMLAEAKERIASKETAAMSKLFSGQSMADQLFDYSKTAAESSWEPRGVLQLEQKIEDSAKTRSCSVHKGFDEDVERISGGECHG